MASSVGESRDGAVRREVDRLLAEIDAELAHPVLDVEEFGARVAQLKQRMIAPAFMSMAADRPAQPSPMVSVIMPTRNRAGFIGEAIASIQAQSFTNWELIVVDDGSSDRTSEVVATFSADHRIRYVSQEFSGHSVARNHGLRMSRGALVAYLDSDNLWYPTFLAAAVALLNSCHDVDCVYGALETEHHHAPPRTILFEPFERARLLRANYIDLNTFVHRRPLTDRHGGFDESLDRFVDWDLVLRLTRDKPAQRVPVLAAQYRVVDDQRVTTSRPEGPSRDVIRRKWGLDAT